jgi:prepilin-type N-terminal cleavage/methylation domain-containing protein
MFYQLKTAQTSTLNRVKEMTATRRRGALLGAQRGFSLVEFSVVLLLTALGAVFATKQIAERTDEASAAGVATYIKTVADAAQRHALINFYELSNGVPVPGSAIPLAPTVAELKTLGRLPAAFPILAPGAQTIRVDIAQTGCPGASCILTASACTSTAFTLRGRVREDLATTTVMAMNGTGGRSMVGDGARVRGPSFSMTNPAGNVEGVVCGQSIVDTALFNRFVMIQDTRDPNLLGKLTAVGDIGTNGGTTTSCLRAALLGTGSLQAKSINCVVRAEMDATGSITSRDALGTPRSGLRFGATGVSEAYAESVVINGSATLNTACSTENALIRTSTAGSVSLLMCQGGVWRTASGTQQAVSGAACTPEGARAVDSTGADMLCLGGTWQPITSIIRAGTAGTSCALEGATANDLASGDQLLCRQNPAVAGLVFMRLRDITQHLQFVSSTDVKDGDIIIKPTCTSVTGIVVKPILQMTLAGGTTTDGGISIYSQDNTTFWTARLRNGGGTVLTGTPNALARADVYCYFG